MAAPKYKVKKQVQHTVFNPDGSQAQTWTVHVEHEDGTQGQVTLPANQYNARNVHQAIQAQADTVAAVAALPDSAQGA